MWEICTVDFKDDHLVGAETSGWSVSQKDERGWSFIYLRDKLLIKCDDSANKRPQIFETNETLLITIFFIQFCHQAENHPTPGSLNSCPFFFSSSSPTFFFIFLTIDQRLMKNMPE